MPIGKPALVKPQGTEIVGRPSRLNGRVLDVVRSSLARRWSMSARSSEIVNGGTGVVGVTMRSAALDDCLEQRSTDFKCALCNQ